MFIRFGTLIAYLSTSGFPAAFEATFVKEVTFWLFVNLRLHFSFSRKTNVSENPNVSECIRMYPKIFGLKHSQKKPLIFAVLSFKTASDTFGYIFHQCIRMCPKFFLFFFIFFHPVFFSFFGTKKKLLAFILTLNHFLLCCDGNDI